MKDFYDIYIFLTKFKNDINISDFKKAFNNTLTNRNALDYLKDYNQIFDEMLEYETLKNTWNKYSNKNKYAENIEFDEIIKVLRKFIKDLGY